MSRRSADLYLGLPYICYSQAAVSTSPGGYSAVADSNGDYSIADVAPGVYEVTATAPGYTPRTLTGVTVNAGETAEASFALAVATGTISGIVTNKDGAAMAGVTVTTGTGGYSAATGAGGSYTISGVAAGTYSVTAAKQGYQPETRSGVVVTGGQTTACSFSNIYVALQEFETAPVWTTSFDAPWGNPATFAAVTGGVSGNFLQASRGTQGSSSRVLVYSVPANATLTLSCSMKCPSYPNSYWVESAYRLGSYSAEDFDSNSGSWTLVKKFSNSGADNGNGNVWTKYSKTISTGSNTQISVGFKHGALGYTGPAVGWDGLLLD